MKLVQVCVAVLIAGLLTMIGCGGEDRAGRGNAGTSSAAATASVPRYTASEKDAFHPNSQFESSRKRKLTNFGSITIKTPEATPNAVAATAAIQRNTNDPSTVIILDNPHIRKTSFPFDYENDVAALKKLHALHRLGDVVKNERSEMENLAALAVYTNHFLAGGTIPETGSPAGPSALDITRKRLENKIGGGSEVHAALFCQLALSCGYTARLVSMHTFDDAGKPLTYDIAEVYVNDLRKWVAFDPFSRATYYLKDGAPLSALEIHTIVVENRLRDISPVPGIGDVFDFVSIREDILPRYRYIYLWRMNDFLGTGASWDDLYPSHLVWEDRLTPLSAGKFEELPRFSRGVKYVTHEHNDFEWDVNLTTLTLTRNANEDIQIYLDTMTPNFSSFSITGNNTKSASGCVYTWGGQYGDTFCMSLNTFGMKGSPTGVVIMP